MILTVTPNSALDRVIFIDRFQPGTVMRSDHMVEAVGGKGFNASVALRGLGLDTLAVGVVAGETGRRLAGLLEGYGVRTDLTWVEGETRTAHVMVETDPYRHSHITVGGYAIMPAAQADLLARYRAALPTAGFVLMGGSLPAGLSPGFYATLVDLARAAGAPALVDGSGQPALLAARARPDVLKMNAAEFAGAFGLPAGPLDLIQAQAAELYRHERLHSLVITCGARGILALTPSGYYHAVCPEQPAVNAAGAGDAVSAALAWRLSAGDEWPVALRWAAAAGAAAVLTPATGECRRADVERLHSLATVRPC